MQINVYEVLRDKVSRLGEYEFQICPRIGEVIQVSGPMGDLDFVTVIRIEHSPVEIPRSMATEDKEPTLSLYVEFESRYSG